MSLAHDGEILRELTRGISGCPVFLQKIDQYNYDHLCCIDAGASYSHRVVPVSQMIANAHFRPAYRLLALYDTNGFDIGVFSYERVSIDTIQLHTLTIFERHQCKGYGGHTLQLVRRLAGALGAKYVRALVEKDDRLLRFYTNRDFKLVAPTISEMMQCKYASVMADAIRPHTDPTTHTPGGIDHDLASSSAPNTSTNMPFLFDDIESRTVSSPPSTPTSSDAASDADDASVAPRTKRQYSATD